MSAISAIVINDGQTTPVAHTFNPVQSNPNALYRENQAGLALIGQPWITCVVKPDSGNGLNKVVITLDLPALETVTGQNASGYTAAPKVAYENKFVGTFFLPSRGTSAQRKDLRVLLANLLANSQVVAVLENLEVPY